MMDLFKSPQLVNELLGLMRSIRHGADVLCESWSNFEKFNDLALDELIKRVDQQRFHVSGSGNWTRRGGDSVLLFIDNWRKQVAFTEALLLALDEVATFEGLPKRFVRLRRSVSEDQAKLSSMRLRLSALTPIHSRVQRHLRLMSGEYEYGLPNSATESRWDEAVREFYSPLVSARDRFFDVPTLSSLGVYLSTAEELSTEEHPLATVENNSFFERHESLVALADELLSELIRDELMLELLENER